MKSWISELLWRENRYVTIKQQSQLPARRSCDGSKVEIESSRNNATLTEKLQTDVFAITTIIIDDSSSTTVVVIQ